MFTLGIQVAGSISNLTAIVLPGVYGPGSKALMASCADADKAKEHKIANKSARKNFTITIQLGNVKIIKYQLSYNLIPYTKKIPHRFTMRDFILDIWRDYMYGMMPNTLRFPPTLSP